MLFDRRDFLSAGLVLAVGEATGNARASPALRVLTEEAPPYNYTELGRPTGFCTELVQAVLQQLQVRVQIESLPWARAYDVARNSENVLIYSIVRTELRENLFKWAGELTAVEYSLFGLAERGLKLDNLNQAQGLQIATINTDVGEQFLEGRGFVKGRQLQSGVHNELNFEKLKRGRVDLWITADLIASHLARQAGDDMSRLLAKALPLPDLSGSYWMAFGPSTSNAQVELFSAGLKAIKKNGQYELIRRKWLSAREGSSAG